MERTSRLNVGYLNKVKGTRFVLSSSGYVLVNLVMITLLLYTVVTLNLREDLDMEGD